MTFQRSGEGVFHVEYRKFVKVLRVLLLGCALILIPDANAQSGKLADWLTDGGDIERTAWQKNEHLLSTTNVKNMKLLWKTKLDNEPRQMHNLLPGADREPRQHRAAGRNRSCSSRASPTTSTRSTPKRASCSGNIISKLTGRRRQAAGGRRHPVPRRHHRDAGHRPDRDAGQIHRSTPRRGTARCAA